MIGGVRGGVFGAMVAMLLMAFSIQIWTAARGEPTMARRTALRYVKPVGLPLAAASFAIGFYFERWLFVRRERKKERSYRPATHELKTTFWTCPNCHYQNLELTKICLACGYRSPLDS